MKDAENRLSDSQTLISMGAAFTEQVESSANRGDHHYQRYL